ncbi:MAG TPA: hypothetical protein VHM70_33035 [Polyangiaceae bacterium]|jgi:hypothetical protein|nr:hypothetical protein [Polyangiaceae bacterium]
MLFGLWGSKKPKHKAELDEVYVTRRLADGALVRAAIESPLTVMVSSFFPASLERIERALTAATGAGSTRRVDGGFWPSLPVAPGSRWLLDARRLTHHSGFHSWLNGAGAPFLFLFVEHFPRWSTERDALDVIDQGSVQHAQHVRFFIGLDEPLMRAFDGDRIVKLMHTLGAPEDEKLSHPLIDKSIVGAQKKLDARAKVSVNANSDEEWFALNNP